MDFEIPGVGVYVLTGSNGSGKTTLMVCMQRLKNTRAFSENFARHKAWNVDSYHRSSVTYSSNRGKVVKYTYRRHSNSWRPTTRNTDAIKDFDYHDINIIPTLGKRIYVQQQVISGGKVKAASDELRQAMTNVLENSKFEKLLKINLGETRGRGGSNRRNNTAFLIPKGYVRRSGRRTQTYFSESNFSLGEIFSLNLLFELQVIKDRSLLVIDELEVALHPKVQINLMNYLEQKAVEKSLTVVISTHSSSLIKCAPKLIYLDNQDNGKVQVHYNCYPTLALQEVAVEEDIQPDYVFFVEDDIAELLLKEMIKSYFTLNNSKQPLWKILPIGGYPQILRFTKRANGYLLHRRIGQYAFLDQDVETIKNDLGRKGNKRTEAEDGLWKLFETQSNKTRFLPVTPELGLWNWISTETNSAQSLIRERFPDAVIDVRKLLKECTQDFPNPVQNPREDAKHRISCLCNQISEQTNEDKRRINQYLFGVYTEHYYSADPNRNSLRELFGPIFNQHGNR